MIGVRIWIDDLRPAPKGYIWCKTYNQAIATINDFSHSEIELICFDHDISCEKTGYDIAKYIVENNIKLKFFSIHSQNIVGVKNIRHLLTHYGYKEVWSKLIK